MKRKIILILILTSILGISAITIEYFNEDNKIVDEDNKIVDEDNKIVDNEEIYAEREKVSEEMLDTYKRILPRVESLFTKLNIDYTLYTPEYKGDNKGAYGIIYMNYENANPGTTISAKCDVTFNTDIESTPDVIIGDITQALDRENIINNGFKFIESPFYKLLKIFLEETAISEQQNIDYSSLDIMINEAVKSDIKSIDIRNTYGSIKERILIVNGEIFYNLEICSK